MLWNGIMTCMFQTRKLGQQREAKQHGRPYSEWEMVNSGHKTSLSLSDREKWTPKWCRISVTWISLLSPPYFSPRKFLPIRCWYFKRLLLNLVIFPLEVVFFYSLGSIYLTQLGGAVPGMVGCSAACPVSIHKKSIALTAWLWASSIHHQDVTTKSASGHCNVPWWKFSILRIAILEERKQRSWNKYREYTLK